MDYVVNPASSTSIVSSGTFPSQRAVQLNSDLSALSIRATEYLQRWKEVVQFASKDYSDQMRAQFGIKAPEYMGNHAHYIGGWSNVITSNYSLRIISFWSYLDLRLWCRTSSDYVCVSRCTYG